MVKALKKYNKGILALAWVALNFVPKAWGNASDTISEPTGAETGDAGPFQPVVFSNGIQFLHPDNQGEISLRFRMQNRADFFTQSTSDLSVGRMEWQVRRLRLRFGGYVTNPKLTFNLQLSFSRADMDWANSEWPNVIRDALIRYDFSKNFQVAFGQGKLPGNRQRVVSSGDLQFVDRSIVNAAFNIDRDFGFQFQVQNSNEKLPLKLKGSVSSGEGRNLPAASNEGLGYVLRGEILPLGEFTRGGDYFEGDLVRESTPKLALGLGGAFFRQSNRGGATIGPIFTTSGDPNSGSPIRRDQSLFISDLMFKYVGWSVLAEYVRRHAPDPVIDGSTAILVGDGFNFQVGKFVTHYLEIGTRFSIVNPRPWVRYDHDLTKQYSIGSTYYISGHRVKLQGELGTQIAQSSFHFARLQFELGI